MKKTTDSGKVKIGAIAPSFPKKQVKDGGKVRVGAIAPSF